MHIIVLIIPAFYYIGTGMMRSFLHGDVSLMFHLDRKQFPIVYQILQWFFTSSPMCTVLDMSRDMTKPTM